MGSGGGSSSISVQPCTSSDAAAVARFLGGSRGKSEQQQLHHRTLALIAWHEDASCSSRVVGYLSSDFSPAAFDRPAAPAALASLDAVGLGFRSSTSAYLHRLQADEELQAGTTRQLLQAAFLAMPTLSSLLLVSHSELEGRHSGLAVHFSKVSQAPSGLRLYEASRRSVLPPLQVRRARVEDHDELLPLVAAAAAGSCPSLAALPACCRPEEDFALTRLISSQDRENIVLVAADGARLVGMLAATAQLDIGSLHASFDLSPFDGFWQPDVYEAFEAAAQQAAAEVLLAQQQQQPQEPEQQGSEREDVATATDAAAAAAAGDVPGLPQPSDEQVRKELLSLLTEALADPHQQGGLQHRLVAVTMLCMQPGFEARAADFLRPAFDEFDGKDFCALSLPHSTPEPPLARLMTQLRPLPGAAYPEALLLLHRAACLAPDEAGWCVRLAAPEDMLGLHGLIEGLQDARELQEAFLHALGRKGAVVATAMGGEVVAMAATSPGMDLQLLAAGFRLGHALPAACLEPAAATAAHALLDCCVINPIFSNSVGALLAETLHLLGKSVLHFRLVPGQAAPEWLSVMQQQPAKRSPGPAGEEFALFSFTKQMATVPKHAVNAKVVVAGASETALACIEQLLLQPRLSFTHLTLLAPGGVPEGGVAAEFSAPLVARAGLQAGVAVVDAHMLQLDSAEQVIGLADGSSLPFDLLVVATGLQDQLGAAVASSCPEAAHFVLSSQQLVWGQVSREAAASLEGVLLYGADLAAFDVVAALQEAGVPASAITWVRPDDEQQAPLLPLLYALAAQLRLELPSAQQAQLLGLMPTGDGARAVATLQADASGPAQELELDLLVGCGRPGPSATVARCLGGACLMFDGRLVVDAGFRSSNQAVMGAGPVAKFSRRYTLPAVQQEQYSSTELGAALATSIVRSLAAGLPADALQHQKQDQPQEQLPALRQGKVQACRLPGGRVFAFAGCPAATRCPSLTPPAGGRSLISLSPLAAAADSTPAAPAAAGEAAAADESSDTGSRALINICLDANDVIHHVAFLGPHEMLSSAPRQFLAALVGLPFSYLAPALQLPFRAGDPAAEAAAAAAAAAAAEEAGSGFAAGLLASEQSSGSVAAAAVAAAAAQQRLRQPVSMRGLVGAQAVAPAVWLLSQHDLLAQLAQPWAGLLFHESFGQLRQQLGAAAAGCGQGAAAGDGGGDRSREPAEFTSQALEDLVVGFLERESKCGSRELQGYRVAAAAGTV